MTRSLPLKCIILAAGASKRLGQHKALLVKDGVPLIRWLVNRLEAQGINPIIVTRQELMIDIALACPERTVIVNPDPDAGRTGTIRCGILHINSEKEKMKPYRLLMRTSCRSTNIWHVYPMLFFKNRRAFFFIFGIWTY